MLRNTQKYYYQINFPQCEYQSKCIFNPQVPTQHLIPSESVTVYKELGEGEFGVVQQGVWTDEDGMRHQVAVKCLRLVQFKKDILPKIEILFSYIYNSIER